MSAGYHKHRHCIHLACFNWADKIGQTEMAATGLTRKIKSFHDTRQIERIVNEEGIALRLRRDETQPKTLNMWIVADNLRKGAALNSVQIAEVLIKDYI